MAALEQLLPRVHHLRLGRINCYLITGPSPVVVDCGLPAHADRVLDAMDRIGIQRSRLAAILLTHRHLDHAGGAARLSAATGARVVIHTADHPALVGAERLSPLRGHLDLALGPLVSFFDRRVFRFRPCPRAEAAPDGWEELGVRLIHLPGHTPGHSAYLHLQSGAVLCGDAAMTSEVDSPDRPLERGGQPAGRRIPRLPSRLFSLDPGAVRRSLYRLADLDAPVYCFGHGPPLFNGSPALRRLAAEG
jgi:glyoxylase-like metal-dependent hydrolase (beta-lactamase superfamily II)